MVSHTHGAPRRPFLLRLSVTDRCNLRCRYCMPASGPRVVPRQALASLEELAAATEWLARYLPVERVKLTGGEPLVRSGVVDLVRKLRTIPTVREISATTNGTLLARLAAPLAEAGLDRVNVSLDTLDEDRFTTLSRGGRLSETLDGIDAACAAGLTPVKLNSVLLADTWRQDVPALLDFASERGFEVRFIELMRTGTEASWAKSHLVEVGTVRQGLACVGSPLPASGPARREVITWRGRSVRVGWISPMSHPFCGDCTRLRLDARGRLRRCLMDAAAFPLVEELRNHEENMQPRLEAYLAAKQPPSTMGLELPMATVGG